MKTTYFAGLAAAFLPVLAVAEQPQIPTLQVCNLTGGMAVTTSGSPLVHIVSRSGGMFTGNVNVTVNVSCDSTSGFPVGTVLLTNYGMNDSGVSGPIQSVRIDQVTSTGTANPTSYMSGLCVAGTSQPVGAVQSIPCHFWLLVKHDGGPNSTASNGGPDIVSFLVFDKTGKRIAYATGPVTAGSGVISVAPTLN